MKRIIAIIASVVMCAAITLYFLQSVELGTDGDIEILKVYNWEEYISEGEDEENPEISLDVIEKFETYCSETLNRNVKVEYSTFGTNENMYNELNLSKKTANGSTTYSYDLVCPSEYMIMKMMRENMLEPLKKDKITSYYDNASSYIQNLFSELNVEGKTVSDYAICYMWGTLGTVYNPEYVDEADAEHWSLIWNDKYAGTGTIKDSVRDSYVAALGYVYADKLMALKVKYENGELSEKDYNLAITEVFNDTSKEAVNRAGEALIDLKSKLFGYEVDSGKKDMITGKILINYAWSGDAVYTMDTAEEDDLYLNYAIPTEGSNIWFDGWVMPKGANVDLATEFMNFISSPEIAQMNMNYIGYTSSIAGDAMFANAVDWYGYTSEDVTEKDGAYFTENEDGEEIEVFPVDLSYFFTDLTEYSDAIIYSEEIGRQLTAQYPDISTISRCTVMKSFSDEETKMLNDMWETAKIGRFSLLTILLIAFGICLIIASAIVLSKLYRNGKIFQPKAPDGYELKKIEIIK